MAARRAQQCKLCRFGVAVCQTGFRKVHVQGDPECRLHGIAERMNVRAPQRYHSRSLLRQQQGGCNDIPATTSSSDSSSNSGAPLTTRSSSSPGGTPPTLRTGSGAEPSPAHGACLVLFSGRSCHTGARSRLLFWLIWL